MGPIAVTLAVATYGDQHWRDLGNLAASRLATDHPHVTDIVRCHGTALHRARNACLDNTATEWIAYVDADDDIEPGYLPTLTAPPDADIRVPSVRHVTGPDDTTTPAAMPRVAGHRHTCGPACLACGNWIVIGALARTSLLRKIGGWHDRGWEDWHLWARCWQAGAHILPRPAAVYRHTVRAGSRGRYTPAQSLAHHLAVARELGLPLPVGVR